MTVQIRHPVAPVTIVKQGKSTVIATGSKPLAPPAGTNGWTPELGVVIDGERLVYQIIDWSGGTGGKPVTGNYLGPTGFVSDIALAVDVRGSSGYEEGTNTGGTANGIVATTTSTLPAGVLASLPINLTNTATPVTVNWNGNGPIAIKTQSQGDIPIGGLVGGSVVFGIITPGGDFQLFSDISSSAFQIASEAARDEAEAARDLAQAHAANAATASGLGIHSLRNAVNAQAIVDLGANTIGDLGGARVIVDPLKTGAASIASDLVVNGLWPVGKVTKEHFGLKGDGSDETTGVIRMLDWITNHAGHQQHIDIVGKFGITQPLTLGGGEGNNIKIFTGEMHIEVLSELGAGSTILTVEDMDQIYWSNHTYLIGGGEEGKYDTFLADNGVDFRDCRHIKDEYFHVYRVRNWGVVVDNESGSGDIQSFDDLGKAETVDCGHVYGGEQAKTTHIDAAIVNNGSQYSNNQTSSVSLANLPIPVEEGDFLVIDDQGGVDDLYPYYIDSIVGNTVNVFPWLHSGVSINDTVGFIKGGGIKISGNNSNLARISQARGIRCGITLMLDHSYNAIVEFPYSQACNVPLLIGKSPSSAVHGAVILGFGSEAGLLSTFGPVMLTRAADSMMIQGYPWSKDWIGLHRPRGNDDTFSRVTTNTKGMEFELGKDGVKFQQWNNPRNYITASASGNTIENGPKSYAYITEKDPDARIKFNPVYNEDCGYGSIVLDWAATDKTSASNFELELDPDDVTDGWTMGYENDPVGATSMTIPNLYAGVRIVFLPKVDSKRWIVTLHVGGLADIAVERVAADGETDPDVSNIRTLTFDNSSATIIASLVGGLPGQRIRLVSENSNTTIQYTAATNNGAIRNNSAADIPMTINGAIDLERDIGSDFWRVVGEGSSVDIAVERVVADGETTPDVSNIQTLTFNNTAPTVITALDGGVSGQRIRLVSENSNTTIKYTALTNSGAIRNINAADIPMTINGAIDVERDIGSNFWRVVGVGY